MRPLAPNEPGLRCAFGVSGSGKTYWIARDVERAVRSGVPVVVVDQTHEWSSVPRDLAPVSRVVGSTREAREAFAERARLVVVQVGMQSDVVSEAEDACRWATEQPGTAGVAIPEAHEVAPNVTLGSLSPALRHAATRWRHTGTALWLDTQRIATLCHGLTDNARDLRIFATVGDPDIARLRTIGGPELVSAVRQCTERLSRGEAGWHVHLGLTRLGPYEPVRV